jgi:hypothetical protein
VLDGLGLTVDQEALYVTLIDVPSATKAELRAWCPDVRVGPDLAALERTGLVSRLAGTPIRYTAAPRTRPSNCSRALANRNWRGPGWPCPRCHRATGRRARPPSRTRWSRW